MPSLLIVEDDAELLVQIEKALAPQFKTYSCSTVTEAVSILRGIPVEGLLCDYVLPDGTAHDIISTLSFLVDKPKTIIMTAHAEKEMAIKCLNLGVSGLIEKPFMRETLLLLVNKHFNQPDNLTMTLSRERRSVTIGEREFGLTEIEFNILSFFLNNSGKWVSRQELIHELWGETSLSRNTLDTHLLNLKNKIPSLREAIVNLRGRGYSLDQSKIL